MKKLIISLLTIAILATGGLFGYQYFTHTGIFKIPGTLIFADSLTDAEKSFISSLVPEDYVLDADMSFSAQTLAEIPSGRNYFLYDVFLPVADFYDTRVGISLSDIPTLPSEESTLNDTTRLISFKNLTSKDKLLSLEGNYYLDTLDSGALFRYIIVEDYGEKDTSIIDSLSANLPTFPEKSDILSLVQTGVTALSRGMNAKLAATGDATLFVDSSLKSFLAGRDYVHTSNESSFSPYASASNICSDSRMLDTLLAINLNIVELTGNHNIDCGDTSALDTLETYKSHNISYYGGGADATDAARPLELKVKNTGITMLAFNYSTGGMTYDSTPGANSYDESRLSSQINSAKQKGDYVIVDVQFNECNAYASTYEDPICDSADSSAARDGYTQSAFFRHLIDMGADMVVGTSAHQAQTYELYGDGVIYYGLGNLFFDQIWWPGTTRSLMLASYFYNGAKLQTRLVGTVYDKDMTTRILDDATFSWWLDRLNSAR